MKARESGEAPGVREIGFGFGFGFGFDPDFDPDPDPDSDPDPDPDFDPDPDPDPDPGFDPGFGFSRFFCVFRGFSFKWTTTKGGSQPKANVEGARASMGSRHAAGGHRTMDIQMKGIGFPVL
jgi:hypothetical protein